MEEENKYIIMPMNDVQNRRWYSCLYFTLLVLLPFAVLYLFKLYEEGPHRGDDGLGGIVIVFLLLGFSSAAALIIGCTSFSLTYKACGYASSFLIPLALSFTPLSFWGFGDIFGFYFYTSLGILLGLLVGHFLFFLLARYVPWFKENIFRYVVFPITVLLSMVAIIFAFMYAWQLFRAHINVAYAMHGCRDEVECYEKVAQYFGDEFSEKICISEQSYTRENCLKVLAGREQSIERCYMYKTQYGREFGLSKCIRTVLYHSKDPNALCSKLEDSGDGYSCSPLGDGPPGGNLLKVENAKIQGFHPGS